MSLNKDTQINLNKAIQECAGTKAWPGLVIGLWERGFLLYEAHKMLQTGKYNQPSSREEQGIKEALLVLGLIKRHPIFFWQCRRTKKSIEGKVIY